MLILSTYKTEPTPVFEPDFYELRLDLLEDWTVIPDFYQNKNTIVTIRDKDQGGEYKDTLTKKLNFYLNILENTNFYIDIELSNLEVLFTELSDESHYDRIIVSIHDYSDNAFDNFKDLLSTSNFNDMIYFYKFVYKIDSLSVMIMMANMLKEINIHFTIQSIGKTSVISRILYKHLGSFATYFGEEGHITAPNQLTDKEMIQFNMRSITPQTSVGGVVGGEQVLHSIGLKSFNRYFKKKGINAVYLPFIATEINDLLDFFSNFFVNFYGFSITMPLKSTIVPTKIVNTWLPKRNEFYLTDAKGFELSFKKLQVDASTKIILIGSGAMAETVMNLLPENDTDIYTQKRLEKIKNPDASFTYNRQENVVLINATPIGTNDEDLIDHFKINNFDRVIDLPYLHDRRTKLALFCFDNNIPIVDGVQFWKWQAKEQLKMFKGELVEVDENWDM